MNNIGEKTMITTSCAHNSPPLLSEQEVVRINEGGSVGNPACPDKEFRAHSNARITFE